MKQKSKISWEEELDFFGPHFYFRRDLVVREVYQRCQWGKILDAGCGRGGYALKLAKLGFKVWGIDLSERLVWEARKEARKLGVSKKAEFQVGDVRNLKFPPNFFDVVVCTEVIEHLEDDRQTVEQFKKVLKSQGICLLTVPAQRKYWGIEDDYGGHFRRYTEEELKKLFAGWIIEKVAYFGFPLGYFYSKFIYRPVFRQKIKKNLFSAILRLFKKFSQTKIFARISSLLFFPDRLFLGDKRGSALILVARKRK